MQQPSVTLEPGTGASPSGTQEEGATHAIESASVIPLSLAGNARSADKVQEQFQATVVDPSDEDSEDQIEAIQKERNSQKETEVVLLSPDSDVLPTPSKAAPQHKVCGRRHRARHSFRVFDLDAMDYDRSPAFLPRASQKSASYYRPPRIPSIYFPDMSEDDREENN